MNETLQLVCVIAIVAVAGAYAARAFVRQFHRSDDEARGCAACPAAELDKRAASGAAASASQRPASNSRRGEA